MLQSARVDREASMAVMTRPIIQALGHHLNSTDPAPFLSNAATKIGSNQATLELIYHNNGQFHCYVLQEQIKNDLSVGRKSARVRCSSLMLHHMGIPVDVTERYFASMEPSRFMLDAVFSSTLQLVSISRFVELQERCMQTLQMLAQHLRNLGAQVDYLELYRRCLPTYPHDVLLERVKAERLNGLVVSSGQGFEHLRQLAGDAWPQLARLTLFVPSPRVAEMARSAGAQTVVDCRGASATALLAALRELPVPAF